MTIVLNGTTGITNDGGYTGDGVVFADTTPSNTLVTTTGGNVGIGTSSPGYRLDVAAGDTTADFGYAMRLRSNATAAAATLQFTNNAVSVENGYIRVTDAGLMSFSNKAYIDSSGNLLVGTTTANGRISSVPKAGLSPGGSAGTWASAVAISASGSFGGGVSWIDGSGGYCAWVDDGGTDFNIAGNTTSNAVSGGVYLNGYAATSWSARSDERLKQNIEPITDAANKVSTLRAVTGEYKAFPGARQAFLFAQDVQKVLPEAVSIADKSDPEKPLGLAYTQVIPLLVAAIQEQQAIITALTARVEALEGRP